MKYETVIGLEIHAQLATKSKMFCGCSTAFGAAPNSQVCPVCTGQPGVLPVINKKAVELAIKTALALNCKIEPTSIFARKHYFYPDLPKNFQVSQYELPLATGGYLEIEVEGEKKRIGITRLHLEEDAGKLVHVGAERIMGATGSLVDYNRTGTPLMEIVSEPDLRSPKEAAIYMQTLANLLRYIRVSDARLEEGSLRCDANISLRPAGEEKFGTKTEIKNINSFRAVEKALLFEEARHQEMLNEGEKIVQETRFFNEKTESTSGMRSKEDAHDYRYFPEPDLPSLEPEPAWIEEIRQTLGELPNQRRERFIAQFKLTKETAALLISDRLLADLFEATAALLPDQGQVIANWLTGEITAYLKEQNKMITEVNLTSERLAELVRLINNGQINNKIGKQLLPEILTSQKTVAEIVAAAGLTQISDQGELLKIAQEVVLNNPKQVEQYKSGKEVVMMFLVGQMMKATKGRANPQLARELIKQVLSS